MGGRSGRGVGRGLGIKSRFIDHNNGRDDTKGDQEHQVVVNDGWANLSGPFFNENLSILGKLHIVLE